MAPDGVSGTRAPDGQRGRGFPAFAGMCNRRWRGRFERSGTAAGGKPQRRDNTDFDKNGNPVAAPGQNRNFILDSKALLPSGARC